MSSTISLAAFSNKSNLFSAVVDTENLVAKGDGYHDDTKAIQALLDSVNNRGGGRVSLEAGLYLVSTLRLGVKTSLVGSGNGATIIKQKENCNDGCLIIPSNSAALNISDLTLLGSGRNTGILVDNSVINAENHSYLYTTNTSYPQPYKWINIENVCVYHFSEGIRIERHGFDINICNSTISFNTTGVDMKCTDSSIYNCYITNNRKNGLIITGANNKISNIKSIWNGVSDGKNSAAIVVNGSRNQLLNIETQDNYCSGYLIKGQYNLLTNCMSNTDGYAKKSRQYDPSLEACGFKISGLYNSFSNCSVTGYTDNYGAVFHSPIWVDSAVAHYYPDIFNDIQVLIAKDRLFFNEPYRNVQTLSCKNTIQSAQFEKINNSNYFVSTLKNSNFIKGITFGLSSLNVLVDFQCEENKGELLSLRGLESLAIALEKRSLCLFWNNQKKTELIFDEDAVFNQDDMRLILSFAQYGQKVTVSMLCYEKTRSRGWIKKEVRQDVNIPALYMKNADVRIGDAGVAVKRLALTNSPIPESVFLPYSNTNRIYDGSIVYVDADSAM